MKTQILILQFLTLKTQMFGRQKKKLDQSEDKRDKL